MKRSKEKRRENETLRTNKKEKHISLLNLISRKLWAFETKKNKNSHNPPARLVTDVPAYFIVNLSRRTQQLVMFL